MKSSSSLMKWLWSVVAALAVALTLHAQVVTSGMSGLVRDQSGRAVPGAEVTATHIPTGTTYTAVSNDVGRYNMRGMVVGGPYTVTAKATGFKVSERTDVQTQLATDIDVPITLAPQSAEIVQLEKFVVQGAANELDSSSTGAAGILTSDRLEAKPTVQRSLADMVSASPFVTLRALSGDREEAQITALGQNNRYNSIQIDGSRINDQFGLNGTGLASFYNPISIDTLEQLSLQVSPYDVRYAGFTGASINAVTKRGTNQFHGSAYYYFSGDHLYGNRLQGPDIATKINTGVTVVPKLQRTTWGATLGGPIWKDHLFFFVNYEKFRRVAPPSTPGMLSVDSSQLTAIKNAFSAYNTASGKSIAWGDLGGSANNISEDEKYLAKVDWNITRDHRLSVRYSQTEGTVPQFGSFVSATRTITSTVPTLSASGVTALESNFYSQERKEKNFTSQLFSRWSEAFTTELKFGTIQQDQLTPVNVVAPEVSIYGVTGTDRAGRAISNGDLVAGTDQFRQGNEIFVDTKQYSALGDYVWKNFVFSGGVEREENDFYNLFRQSSYGLITFANVPDFLADRPARIERSVYDPSKRPAADLSDFATTGIFGQAKWNVTPRLNLQAGLRYEFSETRKKPALNQQLLSDSGFRNTGTLDGQDYISPRVAFNLALDDERTTQVRGGAGHFLGRAPWVFFSNSYNAIGVGSYTDATNNPGQGSFAAYLRNFDPAKPIATGVDNPALRREVDFADPGIKLPAVWRGNLGVDRRLPFLDSTLSVEVIHTEIDQALFISNENLKPLVPTATSGPAIGLDGRQRFSGNPSTAANAKYPNFIDLYRIRNVRAGSSTYGTISLSRPMRNHWSYDVAYTRGRSKEAQAIGQTTASGQWQRNVVFNQGAVEEGTSDFEVKDRVQISLAREFAWRKGWTTRASIYYEGRTGNPFSWIYSNDLNGDGQSNDTVAVPSSRTDARFDFSGLSTTQVNALFDYLATHPLGKYAGGVAPKNGFVQPWVNRLDLHVSQDIPLYFRDTRLELFADWINFGSFLDRHTFNYYEEAFRLTNDVFRRQFIGAANYNAAGQIRMTSFNPDPFAFDNTQSRWRIQVGARLKF
jgi:hypothetical protein